MALTSGSHIGPYQVTVQIGEGGMGEVYRATDTKLKRQVALKILPPSVAADYDRLARFQREAEVLASLNHPNIAGIYGLEESGGMTALVMELVEGEDLSAYIARGAIPLADALPIARQIAEALEAAHEQRVIHRDLKPANIKVREDGTVKVLDFGLAKALDTGTGSSVPAVLEHSPTLTARATQMGMIVGTAAYMSPEQARGRAVDRRADIWAFGVVLYEMLTGRRAFPGDDVSDVLASVLKSEPDWDLVPADVPQELRRLLRRCLEKEPRRRLSAIGDARLELEDVAAQDGSAPPGQVQPLPASGAGRSWRRALPWALVAVLLVALGVLLTERRSGPPAPSAGVVRLDVALPPGMELFGSGQALSVSPNGSEIALVGVQSGVRGVYRRRLDGVDFTPVRGTDGATACLFSPDGRDLLVVSNQIMRRIRLASGTVSAVAGSAGTRPIGWSDDGRVIFTAGGRLWMSGDTPDSPPVQLTKAPDGSTFIDSQPVTVPGGRSILFTAVDPAQPDTARIDAVSIADGARKTVVERGAAPLVLPTGHLLFLRDGVLLAAPFDVVSLATTGDGVPVVGDAAIQGQDRPIGVSASGMLVYAPRTAAVSSIVRVSRTGEEQLLLGVKRSALNPRMSPDGRQILFDEARAGLRLYDLERKTLVRLSDEAGLAFALFSRDGRDVFFRSQDAIVRQRLDSSVRPVRIPGTATLDHPTGFTPDGRWLLLTRIDKTTSGDIVQIPRDGGQPQVLLSTPAYEGAAQISPDGRWMLYVSNERGSGEVFVQPYPALDRQIQVSSSGGRQPVWNPKGGEIIYRNGEQFLSVRLSAGPSGPILSEPEVLFSGHYAFGAGVTIPNYAVTNDGQHLILAKDQGGVRLSVVLNWFDELRRTLPAGSARQ